MGPGADLFPVRRWLNGCAIERTSIACFLALLRGFVTLYLNERFLFGAWGSAGLFEAQDEPLFNPRPRRKL
jgi:hypothetical protein